MIQPNENAGSRVSENSNGSTSDPVDIPKPFTTWAPIQFFAFRPDKSALLLGDGYVEKGERTTLVGIGGLGKSRIILWYCICQITGRKWCGINTGGDPQKCLVLSPENSIRRWKTDLQKMYLALDEREATLVDEKLRLLALTQDEEGDINLWDPEIRERIIATIKQENPGIIIFDPFADMIEGDENSATDIRMTMKYLHKILRKHAPNVAVIIVHHARTGKLNVAQAGNRYEKGNFARGSKALYGKVRCELQLSPGIGDGKHLVLTCGKANNAKEFDAIGIIMNEDDFSYEVDKNFDEQSWRDDIEGKRSGKTVSIGNIVRVVFDLGKLTAGGEVMTGDIVSKTKTETGASERSIKTRLKEALDKGYLSRGSTRGSHIMGSKSVRME
jgi:hypothetical protein